MDTPVPMPSSGWSSLKNDNLVNIFSFLSADEIAKAAMTNKDLHASVLVDQLRFRADINWKDCVIDTFSFRQRMEPFRAKVLSTTLGQSRSGHSSNVLNTSVSESSKVSHILVVGGATWDYRFTNTYECITVSYSPDIGAIAASCSKPVACQSVSRRWLHTGSTLLIDGKPVVLVFGGQDAIEIKRDMYCLNLTENEAEATMALQELKVEQLGDVPGPRCGHSAVVLSGRSQLLVFGGASPHGGGTISTNSLHFLDYSSWTAEMMDAKGPMRASWRPIDARGAAPSPRYCHCAHLQLERQMFICFGWEYETTRGNRTVITDSFLNDMHIYDIEVNSWTEVRLNGIPPTPRSQAVCMHFPRLSKQALSHDWSDARPGYLVVFGGAYHSTSDNNVAYGTRVVDVDDFNVFDEQTSTWLPQTPFTLPLCRGGVNAISYCPATESYIMTGGMHSDEGTDMPVFKGDIVVIDVPTMN